MSVQDNLADENELLSSETDVETNVETNDQNGGKRRRRRSSKRFSKRSSKRGKKVMRKKTKKRSKGPSKWIMHVKAFCKKTGKTFPEALKDPACKRSFKH